MRGWRNQGLQIDDLYQCAKNDIAEKVTKRLAANWEREKARCSTRSKKPSFTWVMFKTFTPYYILPLLIYLVTECILRVAQPLLLGQVIKYFSNDPRVSYRDA